MKRDWLKRFRSPEERARNPRRVRNGWVWGFPPPHPVESHELSLKNVALVVASIVGGCPMGLGTLTTFGGGFSPPYHPAFIGGPVMGTLATLDAAAEYAAMVFRAPKTGNIRGIEFPSGTATGSPTCDLRLETVDAATGFPSGTLQATNTQVTGVSVTSDAWIGAASNFTADAAVTVGDVLVAKILYASGTSFIVRVQQRGVSTFPYWVVNTGSPAANFQLATSIAVRYSDGSYACIPGSQPWSNASNQVVSSADNPNHYGNRFTPAVPLGVIGGWLSVNSAPGVLGNFDMILAMNNWDGVADNDAISNFVCSCDRDVMSNDIDYYYFFQFSAGRASLAASGSIYRLIQKPTTSTNIEHMKCDVSSTGILNQIDGWGSTMYHTRANNPTGSGSWTDFATQRSFMGLWIDAADDGAAGGAMQILMGDGLT